MPGFTGDVAWVDVLPSMRNFLSALRGGTAAAAATAGGEAGRIFGTSMADAIAAASGKLAAAQKRASDAAGQLAVAQARLNDLRNSGTASAGRLAGAEEAVAKAQRNVELQTANVTRAGQLQTRVQAQVAASSGVAVTKHNALAGTFGRVAASGGLLTGSLKLVNSAYQAMFAAATLTIPVIPFISAAREAGNYQQALTRLVTTAGESQSNLKLVGDGMLSLAGQVGIGANQLAAGMYIIESSGLHGADALNVLKASAQGARQEQADLGTVANAVSTILHDYHRPASEAADVTSKLIAAVSRGKVTFEDFTGSLHSITPLAAALKIPLSDIVSVLSAMTMSGETAQQATENMRNALMSLQNPSQQMITELSQLGFSSQQVSEDLGTKGLSGTMEEISRAILTKMGPSATFMLDAFNKSQSAAQDMRIEIQNMPPAVAKLAEGLLKGTVSVKEYRTAVRDMGGQAAALGLQFLSSFQAGDGFNQILKSGKPEVQTYGQALQKAVGTTAALSVALQTTKTNAGTVATTIDIVNGAVQQADGNIRGWAEVQNNFNQKLAEAGASLQTLAIKLGNVMLPALTTFVGWVAQHAIPGLEQFGRTIANFVSSTGFQSFLSGLVTIIRTLVGDIAHLVGAFVASGGLHDALTLVVGAATAAWTVLKTLATIAETVFGTLIRWFGLLPGGIQAAVLAFAALRIAASAGLFDGLLLRGAYLLDFLKKLVVGAATAGAAMVASFREAAAASAFEAEIQGATTAASRFTGAISGIGAAAGTAARGGLAAMGAGVKGIIGLLGGPWGVAALLATGLIVGIIHAVQAHNAAVEQATKDVTAWYKAMATGGQPAVDAANNLRNKQNELIAAQKELTKATDDAGQSAIGGGRAAAGYGNSVHQAQQKVNDLTTELRNGKKSWDDQQKSMSDSERAAQNVAKAQADLEYNLKLFGPTSEQAAGAAARYQTALNDQKGVQDQLNQAEQTHLQRLQDIANKELAGINSSLAASQATLQFKDAVDQLNQGVADGTLKGNALTEAQNALAQQALQTAQAAGQQATDQAKANNITDDGTRANKAILQSLKDSAAQTTGPTHDAIMKMIDDMSKATAGTGTLTDTTDKMGLHVIGVWDQNTRQIKGATDAQIKDLQDLGYEVVHLPDGSVIVTSDTGPARSQLNSLITDYSKTSINIGSLPINSGQKIGSSNLAMATGGKLTGSGTDTSDNLHVLASPNEWVIKASSSRGYGDVAMASINAGTAMVIPHAGAFAAGGQVSGPLYHGPARPNPDGYPLGGTFPLYDLIKAQLSASTFAALSAQIQQAITAAQTSAAAFSGGGGGGGSPAMRALGLSIANSMGYGGQFSAIDYIFTHESGWNPNAQNPTSTAYGIPQFLNSTWAAYGGKTSDPSRQIRDGILYMVQRYGSPNGAAGFWQAHHWYDQGGLWPSGTTGINMTGGDERVLTPEQDNYFQRFVDSTETKSGEQVQATSVVGAAFYGPVYADPAELARQSSQQARRLVAAHGIHI